MRRPLLGARALAALGALSAAATPLAAQHERASLELGVSALSLDGVRPTRSLTLVPSYSREGMSGSVSVAAAMALAPEGEWSAQGTAAATRFIAPSAFGRYEIGAVVGGVTYGEARRTTTSLVQVRSVRGDALDGLWVGLGGGARWNYGVVRPVVSGDVGAWRSFRTIRLTGQLSLTRAYEDTMVWIQAPVQGALGSGPPPGQGGSFLVRRFDALSFGTAVLSATSSRGPLDFDVTVSTRASLDGASRRHGALGALTWHMERRLAVVFAGGRQQPDQVLGIPGGSFATVALRLAPFGNGDAIRSAGDARAGVALLPRRGGAHVLRVDIAGAERVEIAGEFSGWEPLPLVRRSGGWEAVLRLAPGSYRVAIRIDGGEWLPPPGLPQIGDELGGVVGILIVP